MALNSGLFLLNIDTWLKFSSRERIEREGEGETEEKIGVGMGGRQKGKRIHT